MDQDDVILAAFKLVYEGTCSSKEGLELLNKAEDKSSDNVNDFIAQKISSFPKNYDDQIAKDTLGQILIEMLKRSTQVHSISLDSNIQELGMDSLLATNFMSSVSRFFNISISPTILFEYATPREIIEFLYAQYKKQVLAILTGETSMAEANETKGFVTDASPFLQAINNHESEYEQLWSHAEASLQPEQKKISRYNFIRSFIHIQKHRFSVYCRGHGDNIVIFGGFGNSFKNFEDLVLTLSEKFRVYYFCLPGHDETVFDNIAEMQMNNLTDMILEAIDLLIPEQKFHLIGYSLGGSVAQVIAKKKPHLPHSLVLISSLVYSKKIDNFFLKVGDEIAKTKKSGVAIDFDLNANLINDYSYFFKNSASIANLHPFRRPVLILSGLDDRLISAENREELEREFPDASTCYIESANHFMLWTNFSDINNRLIDWLSGILCK